MTKTEARAYFAGVREALREAERALRDNDADGLLYALGTAAANVAEVESDLTDYRWDESMGHDSPALGAGVGGLHC